MFTSLLATATCLLSFAAPVFSAAIDSQLTARAAGDPSTCNGYVASNFKTTGNTFTATLRINGRSCNAYGTDVGPLTLLVEYQTEQRLHVKIYDTAQNVYQVPESVLPRPSSAQPGYRLANQDLKFNYVAKPFSFSVTRQSTGEVLFNTAGWPLIFESQYLGLRTSLPQNPNLYGLGEHTDPFRLNTTNYIRTLWNRDAYGIPSGSNLYGSHPVYFDHRGANGTHGVFLLNSNGMDIKINNTASTGQYLEYNTIGGVFDFYFLSGPTPKDVARQYADTVGHAVMMPYWGFGYHNCRYGYQDAFEVAGVIANYSAANIPLETMWTDIDYMNLRRVFTLDPLRYPIGRMRTIVNYLHSHQQHYIVMVDPAVAYYNYGAFNNGIASGAFLLNSSGLPYQGVVWPGLTAFPDWFASGTQGYWNTEFYNFFNPSTGVDIDGLWIDMNEAANFCAYPCTNPEAYAVTSGNPPRPPPLRLSSPYAIPGFPRAFQPTCVAYVNFVVYGETYYGENILVMGNVGPVANNIPSGAPIMSPNTYPYWRLTVQVPVNTEITYSYPRLEQGNTYILESITRTVTTGGCNSYVTTNDTITTAQGTPLRKRGVEDEPLPRVAAVQNPATVSRASGQMLGLPGRDLVSPPYAIHHTSGALGSTTVNTSIIHQNGLTEYDTHNLYGTMMSAASREAMQNRRKGLRPFIITRSTFAGAGRQVGKWLGDNVSNWAQYRVSIGEMLAFASMFQIPMVGSDACGFVGNSNEWLCARWAMLAAFSPFYRNHNADGNIGQEYYRWALTTAAAQKAIGARYQLLDYIYTALYKQTVTGEPLVNPMFFAYPNDPNTYGLDLQYFYGDSILVAPVVEDNATSVNFYLPNDQFYNFWTHAPLRGTGASYNIPYVAYTDIPLYYKGGSIVPLRANSAMTTTALRQQPFNLIIAPGLDNTATGSLYIDDGESIAQPLTTNVNFYWNGATGMFSMNGTYGYTSAGSIQSITLLGITATSAAANSRVAVAGNAPVYDAEAQKLTYSVAVPLTGAFTVQLA